MKSSQYQTYLLPIRQNKVSNLYILCTLLFLSYFLYSYKTIDISRPDNLTNTGFIFPKNTTSSLFTANKESHRNFDSVSVLKVGKKTSSSISSKLTLDTISNNTAPVATHISKTAVLVAGDFNELPPLESGMVNVTGISISYKVISSNKNRKIIAIPFSQKNIPDGYTAGDVHTYFFSKATNHWVQLKRDSLDLTRSIVYSTTTEDGDYINAIIKTPESPETIGYTPTTLSDIKVGDPASRIQLIEPPIANNQGNASFNFHIESPKGRQGMEPNLNISYSSDGGNGVLGEGWSLNGISSINVETRWGVPQYNPNIETETYLLDGQMLAQGDGDNNLTMAHRNLNIARTNRTTQFFKRRESDFSKIERIGSLGDYLWVITDKNGTKYYYGGTINGETRTLDAVLKNGNKIAEWKLRKIEDQFDNSIEYFYNATEESLNGNVIKSINLIKVRYTIYQGNIKLKNVYELDFDYNNRDLAKDFIFNARYGFLSSTNSKSLNFIKINSVDHSVPTGAVVTNIRKYKFNYSNGSYNKLLLDSISQYGYDKETELFFYSQRFSYYSLDSLKGNYFTKSSIQVPSTDFLGKSVTDGKLGFGGAVGIGLPDFQFLSKSLSFDTRFSYKENSSEGTISFVDINGDSKPDILRKNGNTVSFRPNTSSFDKISFGPEQPVSGINNFSQDDGSSFGVGTEVNGPTGSRVYAGVDQNTANSYTRVYFTDANGDGLIDVVENGEVKFNTYKKGAASIDFSRSSTNTGNPVQADNQISNDLIQEDATRIAAELRNNITISPLHDMVRIWIAPDSGMIRIDAPVRLLQPVIDPANENDSARFKNSDGVVISIQQGNATIFQPLRIQSGDYGLKSISNITARVNKGDKILFRVQSGNSETANGDYDQVIWNPSITYTSKNKSRHYFDAFDDNSFQYNSLKDYQKVNGLFNLPDSGNYTISGTIRKPKTKDDLLATITISGRILIDSFPDQITVKRANASDTIIHFINYRYQDKDSVFRQPLSKSAQVISTNFPVPQVYRYNTSLRFEITSASNFNLEGITWEPKVNYNYYDSIEVDPGKRFKKDSVICYPTINFKGGVIKSGVYIQAKDSGDIRISPVLQMGVNPKPVTMIVSDKDSILLKKVYNQSTFLKDTFSFSRDKGQLFTVSYEIDTINNLDTTLATGKIPSYLMFPRDISDWIVPQTGVYSFFGVGKGSLSSTVFRRNGVDLSPHNSDTLANISLQENDIISFIDTTTKNANPFSVMMSQASAVFSKWDIQDYGKQYRGWGYGVFNATNFLASPIPVNLLQLSETQRTQFYETQFFSMPFDARSFHYTGVNNRTFLSGDTMSSSRMAMAHVQPLPLFIVNGSLNGSGARAVVKYSQTQSLTGAAGALGVTGNKSINAGTISYSDYIDLNGDRHPDIVSQSSVQFTTALGGLKSNAIPMNAGLQQASSNAFGINLGGVFFEPFLASGKSPSQNSNKTSTASSRLASVLSGLSGGFNDNTDEININLYDINGDGLPDKVDKNGQVFLNLGNGFSSNVIPWNFSSTQSSAAHTISFGGGFNNDNNSISGGISIAQTDVDQKNSLIDLNGDGLLDKIVRTNEGSNIMLNTGTGISPDASQRIVLNNSFEIGQSESRSEGINGAYTFSPHIFALFVPVCKIVFSVSSNIGSGNSKVKSQWTDINGDGFLDYVRMSGNNADIMISNLGKINRLKQVTGPLGASYVIDYRHNKADYDHPGGKWVMSSLVVDDGVSEDGDVSRSIYNYDGGKYDRYEREFLGFHVVATTEFLKGVPYRKTVKEYNNDNYFVANQLSKQYIENANGGKYAVKENNYFAKMRTKINRTTNLPDLPASLLKVVVAQTPLKTHREYAQEGAPEIVLLNQTDYSYDSLLNVRTFVYKEGESSSQQKQSFYKAEITYKAINKGSNLYGLPLLVIVKNSNDSIIKKVKASYPDELNGKLQTETIYFSDKSFAATQFDYDGNSGNLVKKTYQDGRVEIFEYDKLFETYITKITDAYKLENNFEYDFRFGLDIKRTLTNGASTKTKYDAFGRIVKIQGPNQTNVNIEDADFTIKAEYQHQTKNPYAIIQHFDEVNRSEGIYTINFIDGLGRSIQIKKTGVVNGLKQWIVSGRKQYDELQRLQRSYYPITQTYDVSGDMMIGSVGRGFVSSIDVIPPTIQEYDVLDRLLTIRLPNNKLFETNAYTIKKDGFGNLSPVTITTFTENGKSNKRELYTNGAGSASTEVFYLDTANENLKKITKYSYEPLHKVDSAFTVSNGKDFVVISNIYDWAGRKINYKNISGGHYRYEYDGLSNLTRKITAKNDTIDYYYDHQRLISVNFPKHPEDSVRYIYSDKTNTGNFSAGKVVFQIDATGAQSFSYDEFGNISRNVRSIIAPFDTTYTFASEFDYDSWGRLQMMVYPSGENVKYDYDVAGNLKKVTGSKHGTTTPDFPYVNEILYDKFEQRQKLTYGNGLIARYDYEDTLRRLAKLKTFKGGAEIMTNTYAYDDMNNVKTNTNISAFENMTPVTMQHDYTYNNQNQLATASGSYNTKTNYFLGLDYDEQFNLKSRAIKLSSTTVKRDISSKFAYQATNPLQLSELEDQIDRSNSKTNSKYRERLTASHFYDNNGNDVQTSIADSFQARVNERKIIWDEENRIRAISNNGYVNMYTYDGKGDRTIKINAETEGVYVNGQFAGSRSGITGYSLYVSPYFSVRNARGIGTKHIYIGNERIVSQLTNYISWPNLNNDITIKHPEKDTVKLDNTLISGNKFIPVRYARKMVKSEALMNGYFDDFELPHSTLAHNSLTKAWPVLVYPINADPAKQEQTGKVISTVDANENLRYFYHTNYLGSTNFISDKDGSVVQYIEYMPFGETFMEQRKDYSNQFLFNGKEQDQETGLYYYGARYYDPATYQWLGVDPMAEKFAGISPYDFSYNNPLRMKDNDGKESEDITTSQQQQIDKKYIDLNTFLSLQIGDAGDERGRYAKIASKLDPNDGLGRTVLKIDSRDKTPTLIRNFIEAERPSVGPKPGSGGRANVTDPTMNKLGVGAKYFGATLFVAGLAYEGYTISKAENKSRALMQSTFGMLGSSGGGLLGAAIASPSGPGAVVVGIGGSMVGGAAGRSFGGWLYDVINK